MLENDAEFNIRFDIDHTTVWVVLGINLALENLVGPDSGDHIGCSTIDGHIVT